MTAVSREKLAALLISSKRAAAIPSKLGYLRRLRNELSNADFILLTEFLPLITDFVSDRFSPARKFTLEMLSPIGIKHIEFLPEIMPLLITSLKDDTPAVARQSIMCGIEIFRSLLFKVTLQGLYSSELDDSLESSWVCAQKFMDEIYAVAFQPEIDGRSLLAIKFVESVILLYTPNPNVSSEPPSNISSDGLYEEFNISWLRGGHPILNVGELSTKASNSLSLLLDQLRFSAMKSLSHLMSIVVINSLSAIAAKRPAFYGRILPVLLGLDPSASDINGKHISAVHHSLKSAFLSCLNCTHPGSAPWRDRLIGALREMKPGGQKGQSVHHASLTNGNAQIKNELCDSEDAKPSIKTVDTGSSPALRKRSGTESMANLGEVDVDEMSQKRLKSNPAVTEGKIEINVQRGKCSSSEPTKPITDGHSNTVKQLVAMFGALVAKGEKAMPSLEILISSISADLLADVVMANMQSIPPNGPNSELEDELLTAGSHFDVSTIGTGLRQLSSLLADIFSQPSTLQLNDTAADAQLSSEFELSRGAEEQLLDIRQCKAASDSQVYESDQVQRSVSICEGIPSTMEIIPVIASEVAVIGNMKNPIPGLDSLNQNDGLSGIVVPLPASTDLDEVNHTLVPGLARPELEVFPSFSTDRSEELSPKAVVTDDTSTHSPTASSVGRSPQFVLPKMSAPVVRLPDEQRDNIQKSCLMRVIDAYKQVAVAGGSHARLSVLAHLAVKLPSDLDAWKMLQVHIQSDYVNHEGHELTLRVLYRLYGQAEEDQDFFSSTAAESAYEMFLLTVAETLRDSFPASDKSLSRLLGDAPHLPNSIFKLLECLCCPGNNDSNEKELYSGDRVTQGLSAVWSLILLRPSIRSTSLSIALQSTTHHLEEVRMKAIRLVANRLYPLPSISQQIETFATETLLSVINDSHKTSSNDDGSNTGLQQNCNLVDRSVNEQPSTCSATNEIISPDTQQSLPSENVSSVAEVQRYMSLYFALCTKKHLLFRQIFTIYRSGLKAVKQAVDAQIPMLIRTIGSSPVLLHILSDPPSGSEKLLIQVLRTLTEGIVPSHELIVLVRQLYETKVKDVEILLPVLPFMSKEEVLSMFPHIVNAPLDKFQAALSCLLEGSPHSGPVLTPAEALIAIHGIHPDKDNIPLKKVTDACNACFDQPQIFTQQVVAKVLNQLVEQIPPPLLFMRTVLQAVRAFPPLVDFIMEILSRLVSKQIWKYPKLWVGFVKCAQMTKPQSFSVLLQLPAAQLENALSKVGALKGGLVAHASQPHIKGTLPRAVLAVLGIASDSQSSSQVQPPPQKPPSGDNKEAVAESSTAPS